MDGFSTAYHVHLCSIAVFSALYGPVPFGASVRGTDSDQQKFDAQQADAPEA